MRKLLYSLLVVGALSHCSRPTPRDLDGKIKGKASLRLADGSTISRNDANEYRPQIVRLSDNYLVLAFGSDRACSGCSFGTHNIFMAKSLTPFDGSNLPFFGEPLPVKPESYAIDAALPLNFAMVASGTSVEVFVNNGSGNLQSTVVTAPSAPDTSASSLYDIYNSSRVNDTVLTATADGTKLIGVDSYNDIRIFDPSTVDPGTLAGSTYFPPLSGIHMRPSIAGTSDAFVTNLFGSSFAFDSGTPLGPILQLDISLAFSELYLGSIGYFYTGNTSQDDIVLISAINDTSEDMYVVTSHTASQLWALLFAFGGEGP